MSPELARRFGDKKFMWDGKVYETEQEAKGVMEGYKTKNFETRMVKENGKSFLYTRRVVTEVAPSSGIA